MASVTSDSGATTYSYDSRSLLTSVSYPNGTDESHTHDPLGRATAITATDPSNAVLSRLDYAYDKNSNPTSITDEDDEQSEFTYDALDRLTSETHPETSISYAYDPAGNRTSMAEGIGITNYTYDAAERMASAGGTTYSHDANGNLVSSVDQSGTTNYAYDFEDRLTEAGGASYAYDAFGRKVSSTTGADTTSHLFDGSEVIRETYAAQSIDYTRGLGARLISREEGSSTTYYHHDSIGSVVGLSGGAGALTDSYSYDAFGNVLEQIGSTPNPYLYLGNVYEEQADLYDFHARHYDPVVGRFMSEDPVAGFAMFPQTLNPYVYGVNNPYVQPDSNGRAIPLIIGIAVLGGGVINGGFSAYEEYRDGGDSLDIVKAGGIGGVAGSIGTAAGIGAGLVARNPMVGASVGGSVGGTVSSGLEDTLSGDVCLTEGLANAGVSGAIGGVAGPIGRIAAPIKPGTFMPNLWKPNGAMSNPKGLGPNSKKLMEQEAYSNAYGGLTRATIDEARNSTEPCSSYYYLNRANK